MNNLENLLTRPTYFILGAGASRAYQFPLWDDLKNGLLHRLSKEAQNESSPGRKSVCERWLQLILENEELPANERATIDHIVERNTKSRVQRKIIINIMKGVIADSEATDKKSNMTGWIEKLVTLYTLALQPSIGVDDAKVLEILRNTKVITLNYDRCFEFHFHKPIYTYLSYAEFCDPDFTMTNKQILTGFFSTYHPHGSMGAGELETIEGGTIGKVQCISKIKSAGYQTNVGATLKYGAITEGADLDLVGDVPLDENYKEINDAIEEGSNCLVMGFSGTGLRGIRLDWDKFKNICYFGSDIFPHSGNNVANLFDPEIGSYPDTQLIEFLSLNI